MINKAALPGDSISSIVAALWRSLLREMLDSYRPERFYMRGPGPKWREKHLGVSSAMAGTRAGAR